MGWVRLGQGSALAGEGARLPQGPSPPAAALSLGVGFGGAQAELWFWGQKETEGPGHWVSWGQVRGSPEGGADPQPQAQERRGPLCESCSFSGPRQRGAPGRGSPPLQDAGLYPIKALGGGEEGPGRRDWKVICPWGLSQCRGGCSDVVGGGEAESSNGPLPGCGPRASPHLPPTALQPGTWSRPSPGLSSTSTPPNALLPSKGRCRGSRVPRLRAMGRDLGGVPSTDDGPCLGSRSLGTVDPSRPHPGSRLWMPVALGCSL